MERLKSSFLNPAELGQSSDVLYKERPLREHLVSFLKVLGKFSLGAVVCGGAIWLGGNILIDIFPHPTIALKEMVLGFTFAGVIAGGLTSATYFSSN